MSSLPLKPFAPNICRNNSGGYFVSLCPSCYALSAPAASLMLQGLRAGLNHNYALPHSLQLCVERRGEVRGGEETYSKLKSWLFKTFCAESSKQKLNESLNLWIPDWHMAPSFQPSHGYCIFSVLQSSAEKKPYLTGLITANTSEYTMKIEGPSKPSCSLHEAGVTLHLH